MSGIRPFWIMDAMSHFLVEIRMNDAAQLERAARMLDAAQIRLRRRGTATRMIIAGRSPDDGQLVCFIEASDLETVRRLISMAFLPPGRIREITPVISSPS
jgi:hypothetical protein